MAEERLIDDDLNKDKKYRIRKNADGEDELYIDETAEEVSFEDMQFEAPDGEEEYSESYAERERERMERQERNRAEVLGSVEEALKQLGAGNREGALAAIEAAEKVCPHDGMVCAAKLRIISGDFTDFSDIEGLGAAAVGVLNFSDDVQKSELAERSAPLTEYIYALEERAAELHVAVEEKKSERRPVFLKERKRGIAFFATTLVLFLACFIVAMCFVSVMHARTDGLNITLAIVFGSLSGAFFIALLFASHKMWDAMRKVSLNEKNSSTKLGREYEETLSDISKLKSVAGSFGGKV